MSRSGQGSAPPALPLLLSKGSLLALIRHSTEVSKTSCLAPRDSSVPKSAAGTQQFLHPYIKWLSLTSLQPELEETPELRWGCRKHGCFAGRCENYSASNTSQKLSVSQSFCFNWRLNGLQLFCLSASEHQYLGTSSGRTMQTNHLYGLFLCLVSTKETRA